MFALASVSTFAALASLDGAAMSDQMIRTEMLGGAIPRVDTNLTDPYFKKVNSNGGLWVWRLIWCGVWVRVRGWTRAQCGGGDAVH